jgi:hypothetical protein
MEEAYHGQGVLEEEEAATPWLGDPEVEVPCHQEVRELRQVRASACRLEEVGVV